jgi:hypothetical protein
MKEERHKFFTELLVFRHTCCAQAALNWGNIRYIIFLKCYNAREMNES